jgi:hypothetical protein
LQPTFIAVALALVLAIAALGFAFGSRKLSVGWRILLFAAAAALGIPVAFFLYLLSIFAAAGRS